MRTKLVPIAVLAIATVSFVGCTTSTPTASNTPAYDQTQKRVYTKEELDKRGRQTPGEALAAQDASITLSGRH